MKQDTKLIAVVLSLLFLGCKSDAPAAGDSSPVTPASPDPGLSSEASDPVVARAGPLEADDSFTRLLASMGVSYLRVEQRVEVKGWVNMQKGLVELFACAPQGKVHEAVVVLDCVPSGLHAGLLALGLEPGTPVEMGTSGEYKPPTGDLVDVLVRWMDAAGKTHEARAEDWVWDEKAKAPMKAGPWIFAGSFQQAVPGATHETTFAADSGKSLMTTYHDAASILENPLPQGGDDTTYYSNERAVPTVGTPVTVAFQRADGRRK